MPSETLRSSARRASRGQHLALCLCTALCLVACATAPKPVSSPPPASTVELPKPIAPPMTPPPSPAPGPSRDGNGAPVGDAAAPMTLSSLLAYGDRLRGLSGTELGQELNALGEPGTVPSLQLQTALVLIHLHQPAASARALGLLQRVVAHPDPESAPFKPLARLLAASLSDQRRLEDTVDRQAQQLRDSQRRIDMLNDRLDAMRDIERSLTPRTPAPGAGRGAAP